MQQVTDINRTRIILLQKLVHLLHVVHILQVAGSLDQALLALASGRTIATRAHGAEGGSFARRRPVLNFVKSDPV